MAEEQAGRLKPRNAEAEMAVIGSILMAPQRLPEAMELLRPEDFYFRQYGEMFAAMIRLYEAGTHIDLITLGNALKDNNLPADSYGTEALKQIMLSVPVSARLADYAVIVHEKASLRRLIEAADAIENMCYTDQLPVKTIFEQAESGIFSVLSQRKTTEFFSMDDVMSRVIDRIDQAASSNGNVTGVPTGFVDLDDKTAGFQPSNLILLAARPSMGKTAFVLNLAQYIAVKKKLCTVFFSLEMNEEELGKRLLSMESGVDSSKLRIGNLNEEEWISSVEAAGHISESNLFIDATPGITVSEMRSKLRKMSLKREINLIIIDYLQLMSGDGSSRDSRQEEVSKISRSLKGLARELNCPVIALSQLSRQVESRPDKRPILSDLRESGAIEQDADVVMFLYRDEYYNKNRDDNKGEAELIIAKQRNGPLGTIYLRWLPQLTRFASSDKKESYGNKN